MQVVSPILLSVIVFIIFIVLVNDANNLINSLLLSYPNHSPPFAFPHASSPSPTISTSPTPTSPAPP